MPQSTEEEDDRKILGKVIWRGQCGQLTSCLAEEYRDGSAGQSRVKTGELWPRIHWE